jgi:hypothetical protein
VPTREQASSQFRVFEQPIEHPLRKVESLFVCILTDNEKKSKRRARDKRVFKKSIGASKENWISFIRTRRRQFIIRKKTQERCAKQLRKEI